MKHLRWLTQMVLPYPCQQIFIPEHTQTISERIKRLARLDTKLDYQAKQWRYYPVIEAIRAMHDNCRTLPT